MKYLKLCCSALLLGISTTTGIHAEEQGISDAELKSYTAAESAEQVYGSFASEEELIAKAEAREPLACFELGKLYLTGQGGALRNEYVAVDLLKVAAFSDDPCKAEAAFLIADSYRRKNTQVDNETAAYFYALAASEGHIKAVSNLAFMYMEGLGVKNDDKEAVRLFEIAAANNDAVAAYYLGIMADTGRCGCVDPVRAEELFRKAADLGHAGAKLHLAGMLLLKDPEQSLEEASELLKDACLSGEQDACTLMDTVNDNRDNLKE